MLDSCDFESSTCGGEVTSWIRSKDAEVGPLYDHTTGELFGMSYEKQNSCP